MLLRKKRETAEATLSTLIKSVNASAADTTVEAAPRRIAHINLLYVWRMQFMRRQINLLLENTLRSASEKETGCLPKEAIRQMMVGHCARGQAMPIEGEKCPCNACHGRAPAFTANEMYDYVVHLLHG